MMESDNRPTPEKILDAAEALFADRGYDGVSLRAITKLAGVELALANYHFGPKQDLFRAVVERRAAEINRRRMQLLDELAGEGSVEQVIDAFVRPFLEKSLAGGGWKNYSRLIAQVANSPRWTSTVMSTQFDPIAARFVEEIRSALPKSRPEDVYWGFHFLLGAVTVTFAETGRIDRLSRGRCRSDQLELIHTKMIPFLAAGFRALCAPGR